MDDLVAFLNARLDEDEAGAKDAAAAVHMNTHAPGDWSWMDSVGSPQPEEYPVIKHEMRHDPARVLREVEAKRAILTEIESELTDDPAQVMVQDRLRHLAAVYSDHPDYRGDWKP